MIVKKEKVIMGKEKDLPLEVVAAKIAALGVPALVFIVAVGATGLAGAAAITAALAALGPGGIVGGIAFLGVAGLISDAVVKFGTDALLTAVIKQLYKEGETKQSIKDKVAKYPVSKGLKLKLYDKLENL